MTMDVITMGVGRRRWAEGKDKSLFFRSLLQLDTQPLFLLVFLVRQTIQPAVQNPLQHFLPPRVLLGHLRGAEDDGAGLRDEGAWRDDGDEVA